MCATPAFRRTRRLLLAMAVLLPWAGCGRDEPLEGLTRPNLTIFAAASLVDVLPELAAAWRAEGGGEIRFSFGPTSKLVPQVEEGAPADALISADVAWIEQLEARGLSERSARVVLARNALVFVVAQEVSELPTSATALPGPLKRIALAGENVPAGRYAKAALVQTGVWAAVEPRVVRGEDVRLTLRHVSGGDAEGGIVYATDARGAAQVRVAFTFPADSHPPILYPAAPIRASPRAAEAARFLAFCRGPSARAIFERFGFLPGAP